MYSKLKEAQRKIKKRRETPRLTRRIEEILDSNPLREKIPSGKISGVLPRHISSARLETIQFLKRAQENDFFPTWLEYPRDKFTTTNPCKWRMVCIRKFNGFGRNGGPKIEKKILLDQPEKWEGKSLNEVELTNGEKLVNFHHRIFEDVIGLDGNHRINLSEWLKELGKAKNYYPYYLTLFIKDAILFEDFEDDGTKSKSSVSKFKKKVVEPALEKIKEWGLPEPLIVKHPDPELSDPRKDYLNWYPAKIEI